MSAAIETSAPEAPRSAPSLSELRRELGARRGWGRAHTYARLTILEKRDGGEEWIACIYASRTGEQGRAHQCLTGVGATGIAALEDLAARAAQRTEAP